MAGGEREGPCSTSPVTGLLDIGWMNKGVLFLMACISLFQNVNGSFKYIDMLGQHATLYYKLNAKEIGINKQNLTGRQFFKVYEGKTWIL